MTRLHADQRASNLLDTLTDQEIKCAMYWLSGYSPALAYRALTHVATRGHWRGLRPKTHEHDWRTAAGPRPTSRFCKVEGCDAR